MKDMTRIHNTLRTEATTHTQEVLKEMNNYRAEFQKISVPAQTEIDRATELTKLEAFDYWIDGKSETKEQLTAKMMLDRVTAKLGHTFKTLKTALQQAIQERDEIQVRMEQQQEEEPLKWEKLLGLDKIEHTSNIIEATMKSLAPPISIVQYYQAYKPLIFETSGLPDLKNQIHISAEQFQVLWTKADPAAKDLLVCMWVLKDLTVPKGIVELTTANPPFYLTRFCLSALTHISKHHDEFYSNIQNHNSLPQLQPYEPETVREIQEMADANFPQFLSTLDILAGEDTTIFHEAIQHHQNLTRKFLDSFPPAFHRIQLHGYVTRALEDRKNTLEQRQISTPHSRTLLYLPQLDPASMKIAKRS